MADLLPTHPWTEMRSKFMQLQIIFKLLFFYAQYSNGGWENIVFEKISSRLLLLFQKKYILIV